MRTVLPRSDEDIAPTAGSGAISVDAAKLEALAEFAAGAGHEINNPVATITGRVQLLLQGETDPRRRQALLAIGGQALRIRDMIGDLMLFARPPRPEPEIVDAGEAIREVARKLTEAAEFPGCRIELHCAEGASVSADRTQFCVVISELIRNGLEATAEGGGVVRVTAETDRSGTFVTLTVQDHGRGLSREEREHLFDPFYCGRQAGRGLGFGLPKCWRIVSLHGGRIEAASDPQEGTTFRVDWPVGRPEGGQGIA